MAQRRIPSHLESYLHLQCPRPHWLNLNVRKESFYIDSIRVARCHIFLGYFVRAHKNVAISIQIITHPFCIVEHDKLYLMHLNYWYLDSQWLQRGSSCIRFVQLEFDQQTQWLMRKELPLARDSLWMTCEQPEWHESHQSLFIVMWGPAVLYYWHQWVLLWVLEIYMCMWVYWHVHLHHYQLGYVLPS